MQLFTIGLFELNDDGTRKLDGDGFPIRAYTNDDVVEYSRVWTGFEQQSPRGNVDHAADNRLDPMRIRLEYRDFFPKMGLLQRYIGDGYPLCADLPPRHFLRKDAKYRLLGSSPLPELQFDNEWDYRAVRFVADPEGALNSALCGADSGISSSCTYPGIVTLSETINCVGRECEVDTVRVVQVEGGMYYEYVRPPCVHQAFVENPRKIKKKKHGSGKGIARYMCADPRVAVASTACCFRASKANTSVVYWGERTLASTSEQRCTELDELAEQSNSSFAMCNSTGPFRIQSCREGSCTGHHNPFYWFAKDAPCFIKVKLDASNEGKIAVVHSVPDEDPSQEREMGQEEEDNKTFFRVQFYSGKEQIADLVKTCVDNPGCNNAEDGHCMCNVIVSNEQAYFSAPTRNEVLSSLHVGSFHPEWLDGYATVTEVSDVKIHADKENYGVYSPETIFEVMDDFGEVQWRKNVRSVVQIVGTNVTFRNPVQFISLAEPTLRDAQYETDAAIDHYVYHKNTGPFLAILLAQRFGTSNPSPGYVREIADAFRTGTYTYREGVSSVTFGQGVHGDLAATVGAILLNREARSSALEAGPGYGSLKEPLLKVTGLMRNLELKSTPEFPFPLLWRRLQKTIGQMAYEAPSVFSFYLPKFQPRGAIARAGLVSPEAQVHSSFNIIGTMNGLLAMIKYGLDPCYDGFGKTLNWGKGYNCKWRIPGQYVNASRPPGFKATDSRSIATIVDELATIMTSGRLNSRLRQWIVDMVETNDPSLATIQAQQLIAGSSEFHSIGRTSKLGRARSNRNDIVPTERPYKALVVLMLSGGYDSYNFVIPHSCNGTNDAGLTVLEQYRAERGSIAMKDSGRQLPINVEGQPCEQFAIHHMMPIAQELYNEGDLSLFLNTGAINKAATKNTYEAVTSTQLFAHIAMREEAQTIDPYNDVGRIGVLGRLSHVLNSEAYGYRAQTFSINNIYPAVNGDDTHSPPAIVMNEQGPKKFNNKPATEEFDPREKLERLNGLNHVSSSVFSGLWSDLFMKALSENEFLAQSLDNVTIEHDCGSRQLNMVVKLMETRMDRGIDRDLFYVSMDGWDHHANMEANLGRSFEKLNNALTCYTKNLKNKGLWEKVTLLVVSEFGRTLTPNTNSGSDHGWAGHYFAMGGSLNGGKVYGDYPSDLTADGPLNLGRGRMMPTLSWESIYTPICEWLDVEIDDCASYVLPNSKKTGTSMLRKGQVFQSGT